MTPIVLAGAALRRLSRDRQALFFMLVLPVVVMLVIGMVAQQPEQFRVAVVGADAGSEAALVARELDGSDAIHVREAASVDQARTSLRRGEIDTVVVLGADLDDALAAGRTAEVVLLADQESQTQRAAAAAVRSVVAARSAVLQAARLRQERVGGSAADNVAAVEQIAPSVVPVTVDTDVTDSDSAYLPSGFGYSAPTMLVLFVFITALAGGAAMIESRRLGIHARMLSAPVTVRAIVVGESLSYLGIALIQSTIIVGIGAFVFGVSWGDPLAAAALVVVWAAVGAGAGMLAGTLFRTPEQATAVGTTTGIAAAMLGGCMWPLEIVGPLMRSLGHLVPHAWAVDGWIEILSRGGGITDIATSLGVLALFAAGLLTLSSVRLRHRLTA